MLTLAVAVGLASFATGDEPAKTPADASPATASIDRAKATAQATPQAAKRVFEIDLIVQKVGTNEEIIKGPPEDLADRITQLPHVTAVARAAMDVGSPKEDLQILGFNRWPPKSPDKHDRENARRLGARSCRAIKLSTTWRSGGHKASRQNRRQGSGVQHR